MKQIAVAVHSGHVPGRGEKARLFVEALAKRCPDAVLLVGGSDPPMWWLCWAEASAR